MDRSQNARRPEGDWWRSLWPDPGGVLRDLGVEAGQSVAAVGAADGHFALAAAEIVAPAPVYAVDLDGVWLDELEARALDRGVETLTTVHGDARVLAERLPEPVDVVLVATAFHGAESRTALAEEVSRSLAPGGRFIVVDWHDRPPAETPVDGEPRGPPRERRTTPEATRRAVEPAGFVATREVDLPPHHYGLVFERAHDQ